ncbi:MAG: hypothetical protein D6B28_03380 [Gammaproteobacteria bacterium]|nr:MAG: hypothetical protein D6B28_03380 [Gammaproteobacteria bacterium]
MTSSETEFNAICGAVVLELDDDTLQKLKVPPKALPTDKASELVNTIAANMNMVVDSLDQYGIIIPAALYDQTEVLTPDFTIFTFLQEIFVRAQEKEGFSPAVIALGSDDEGFPIEEISPKREPDFGHILVIPYAIVAPKHMIDELDKDIDYTLLESGKISDETIAMISEDFGVGISGGFFATLANMCAFLKTQLEKINCAALWELFEQAFFSPEQPLLLSTEAGNLFYYNGDKVITPFMTYQDWLNFTHKEDDTEGYLQWVLAHRQYTIGLQSHEIDVTQVWFENSIIDVEEDIIRTFLENATPITEQYIQTEGVTDYALSNAKSLTLTEKFNEAIGTVAFVLEDQDGTRICEYYPLSIDGIAEAEAAAKKAAESHNMSFEEKRADCC